MKHLSKKMTRQIIHFYETLEDIINYDSRVDLTYKDSCEELNELQLNFNKIAKTINITTKTVKKGKEYRALLNYAEAYYIFDEFKNKRQMGICLANMAALRFELGEYELAQ